MSIKIPKSIFFKSSGSEKDSSQEFGFDESFTGSYSRLLNDDGTFNITRQGVQDANFFKSMINMPWWQFFGYFILVYLLLNLLFSLLYYLGGAGCIQNSYTTDDARGLDQLFYFSVQTFTTVGYGNLHPVSNYANIIATLNAFTGLMFFALVTGLFFSKFSTPVDHVKYSKNLIIAPYQGKKALMIRLVNALDNHIMSLSARLTMSWVVPEKGIPRRKFAILPLEIDSIYLFPLNWTIVHVIDEQSPLFGKNKEGLLEANTEFIVMIKGYDRTYGKEVHSNRSYDCKDLVYGAVFETMYETRDNETILHLDRIDEYIGFTFPEQEEENNSDSH